MSASARPLSHSSEDCDSAYLHAACDELLRAEEDPCHSEDEVVAFDEGTVTLEDVLATATEEEPLSASRLKAAQQRARSLRAIALICTCSLSIGSHYANYILGPLKSRLQREIGTSHAQFGLLIAAYTLNSTWTPLVGGVLASRFGTTVTSIAATGIIFLGQLILLIGDIWGDVRLMVFGLFIFGFGVSPLSVVQETIIVRFFKSHGLGLSMALGLVAGKGASFVAASTSYPLTERFGGRAPFYVATSLAGLSVVVNLIYLASSRWLVDGAGAELEAPDIQQEAERREAVDISEAQALEKVAKKRHVNIRHVVKLGDAFWAYVTLNVLCGMIWTPFIHLAPNLIENRYGLSEETAAKQASYLLVGPIVLYPLCGYVVDKIKRRSIVTDVLCLTSTLTLLAYAWLALPPATTGTPIPAIISYALGHGMSPLLLAVIVPRIVPLKYVSTALGVHKSLEQTGTTLAQTIAGLILDSAHKPGAKIGRTAMQYLLNTFLILNVGQLINILVLAYFQNRNPHAHQEHGSTDSDRSPLRPVTSRTRHSQHLSQASESDPLIGHEHHGLHLRAQSSVHSLRDGLHAKRAIWRGTIMMVLCGVLIASAWVLFLGTAWFKLRTPKH